MKLFLLCFVLSFAGVVNAAKPELTDPATIAPVGDRMARMIIPRIAFQDAKVPDIFTRLAKTSKDLDPTNVGVLFELSPAAKGNATEVTISLNNVPLEELLKYVTHLANLKYQIAATKVLIKSIDEK